MLSKLSLIPLLFAAVSASPLPGLLASLNEIGEHIYGALKIDKDTGVAVTATPGDLDNFKYFTQMVQATACNSDAAAGAAIVCSSDACPAVEANGGKIVGAFTGPTSGLEGFVATDPVRKNIVVAFRSSYSVRNWMTNLLFGFEDCDFVDDCKIHSGFAGAWDEIRDSVFASVVTAKEANSDFSVVATGHSLGGAIATVAAADLRGMGLPTDVYTYGSPRVGNAAFVDFVTNQPGAEFRVTHVDDPVPRLPPMFLGYRHTSPEYWLATGDTTTIDYTVADIRVCEGDANTQCNGGTSGLNIDAHKYYFSKTSACGTEGFEFRERGEELSDDELAARLKTWAQMDVEYSKGLGF